VKGKKLADESQKLDTKDTKKGTKITKEFLDL